MPPVQRMPDAEERAGLVAHGNSRETHLAGELGSTHPETAHDGGSRGVESEGGGYGGFRCCSR
jgi:hypothetical protein